MPKNVTYVTDVIICLKSAVFFFKLDSADMTVNSAIQPAILFCVHWNTHRRRQQGIRLMPAVRDFGKRGHAGLMPSRSAGGNGCEKCLLAASQNLAV